MRPTAVRLLPVAPLSAPPARPGASAATPTRRRAR